LATWITINILAREKVEWTMLSATIIVY